MRKCGEAMQKVTLAIVAICVSTSLIFPHARAQDAPPNFCTANLKPDEVAICNTASLWKLDYQLNDLYKSAYRVVDADQKAKLQTDQRTWLSQRHLCQADRECITNAYRSRISQLQLQAQGAGEPNPHARPESSIPHRAEDGMQHLGAIKFLKAAFSCPKRLGWTDKTHINVTLLNSRYVGDSSELKVDVTTSMLNYNPGGNLVSEDRKTDISASYTDLVSTKVSTETVDGNSWDELIVFCRDDRKCISGTDSVGKLRREIGPCLLCNGGYFPPKQYKLASYTLALCDHQTATFAKEALDELISGASSP